MNKFIASGIYAFSDIFLMTSGFLGADNIKIFSETLIMVFAIINVILVFFSVRDASRYNFTRLFTPYGWATYFLIIENISAFIIKIIAKNEFALTLMMIVNGAWLLVIAFVNILAAFPLAQKQ